MKQRITALLLALFLSLSVLILPGSPAKADQSGRAVRVTVQAQAEEDFQFDAATGTITGYLGTATDVVLPQTIGGVPVQALGKNSFSKKGLTSMVFNEGLEVIGEGALSGNASLKSAVFPSSLRRIEKGAFLLAGFETVTLNEGLEYIGQNAFTRNTSLTAINLPGTLTGIGNLVFQYDTKLTGDFVLGRALGHVGHGLFDKTGAPITLSILEGAGKKLYIHDNLFTAAQTSLTIPQGREVMVFARSFQSAADITLSAGSVEVTDDLTAEEIEEKIKAAVLLTSGFAVIDKTQPDGSLDTYVETGVDWATEGLDLTQATLTVQGSFPAFPAEKFEGTTTDMAATNDAMARLKPQVTLNVTAAPDPLAKDFQFDAATGTITGYLGTATDVVLPQTIGGVPVQALGKNSFSKKGLTSMVFNEGLEVIGEGALSGNASLKSAVFPSSLRRIEKGAFLLAGFETVTLNEGLEYIGQNAFTRNTSLTAINLPASLTGIGNLVFQYDTKLTGDFVLGRALGHVGHGLFDKTGAPITLSILEGAGKKLYLHDNLFTAAQTSLTIPQGREVMVFARSFQSAADITLSAGSVEVTDDLTAEEIEEKIKAAVLLTSGFAVIDKTQPDGSLDTYVETGVDWATEGLDLTQGTLTVQGSFPAFPAEKFEGTTTDMAATNDAMARLKPQVTLIVTAAPDPIAKDYQFDAATGTITDYLGTASDVVLPATLGGVPVRALGKQAFYKKGLNSIVFNEGLEVIGDSALAGNAKLSSAQFPASLRRIEKGAFVGAGFESVELNEGLEYLGQMAFASNLKLTSINLPWTLREIESRVFMNNKLLTGDFVLGRELGFVWHEVFYKTTAPITVSIAQGSGEKLYISKLLFPQSQKSLVIPQDREIMINAQAFAPMTDIILDAGTVDVRSDMTAEEIENLILEKVRLTSGGACLSTSLPVNHAEDVFIKSDIDWAVEELDLSQSSLEVTGAFREIPAEAFAGQTCAEALATNEAMTYLKPRVLLSVEQVAQSYTAADFTYDTIYRSNVAGNYYYGITGFSASGLKKVAANKDLVLPSEVSVSENGDTTMKTIGGIGEHAFAKLGLTSVTLPEPGNDQFIIDTGAFAGNALTGVEIPQGVRIIEAAAFMDNQLQSLSLPGSILKVGSEAFMNNAIEDLRISDDVRMLQLDNFSFANNRIKSVDMPYSVFKTLGSVFQNNPGMEAVTESYGLVHLYTRNPAHLDASTYIFSSEFQKFILVGEAAERKELWTIIQLAEALEEDDYTADSWMLVQESLAKAKAVFSDQEAGKAALLNEAESLDRAISELIPLGVNRKELAREVSRLSQLDARLYTDNSFAQLQAALEEARLLLDRPDAIQADIDDGTVKLLAAEQALVIADAYQWTAEDFSYDGETVTGYSPAGLQKFTLNKALVLPDKSPAGLPLTAIGPAAFKIPDDDVLFGPDSVTSPNGLTSVTLPATIKRIEDDAFRYNALSQVDLPEGLEYIGNTAFNGNQLKEIAIPDTVTAMGNGVFSLNLISKVKLSRAMSVVPNGLLSRNITLTSLTIPEGITEIGQAAFTGAPLTKLSLPDSLKVIGSRAFQAHRLAELEIPASVEVIGTYAFEQNLKWRTLSSLTLNEGLKEIASHAFKSSLLAEVTLPFSLEKLHDKAFLDALNNEKEPVVVTLYTYNPSHLENFSPSASHTIILLEADTEALADLLAEAQLLLETDSYLYDGPEDQARLMEVMARAQAMLTTPTSQMAVDELLAELEEAMAAIDGGETDPGSTTPDPGSTSPDSSSTTPDTDSTIPNSGSTTPDPGSTTPDPGSTTPDPGSTTPDPGSTTPDPGSTTPDPGSTTPDPGTTTPDPGSTTPDPGSTTPDPGTTTPDPGSTTPDPGSTTPDPGTTTPDPGSTTPDPGTTTPDPGSTTPDPGTTTPDPGSTTPDPGSTKPDPGSTIPDKPDSGELPQSGDRGSLALSVLGGFLMVMGLSVMLRKKRSKVA